MDRHSTSTRDVNRLPHSGVSIFSDEFASGRRGHTSTWDLEVAGSNPALPTMPGDSSAWLERRSKNKASSLGRILLLHAAAERVACPAVFQGDCPPGGSPMNTPRNPPLLPEAQLGPAEKLLDLVLSSSAHLWHNRPGLNVRNAWQPAPRKRDAAVPANAVRVAPGLFIPAAVNLYRRLL